MTTRLQVATLALGAVETNAYSNKDLPSEPRVQTHDEGPVLAGANYRTNKFPCVLCR